MVAVHSSEYIFLIFVMFINLPMYYSPGSFVAILSETLAQGNCVQISLLNYNKLCVKLHLITKIETGVLQKHATHHISFSVLLKSTAQRWL